ncbi:threonylcarbamoyl-AMP synthase [Gulosibacter macacae]|uniref:L-threonylcarbamoyladenylate synthase n=1 Tax=Gulosibacter macacae TaxID=2488791 RepID=A0A3P3W1Q0_9MICO|nr:L-threonylcarbamoyladenylate synthase [Gulosibacter macacae]RRJ88704.1 threonylcarbamoyl-AMP synthase [Gulosibacter macacae]
MTNVYDLSVSDQLLAGMREARGALGRGETVVIPTDTVYGIAADAFNPEAVAKLLAAKGRTRQSPPPVLVASAAALEALAEHIPDEVRALFDEFAPGPLTIILPARTSLQWDLGDTRGTVALRIPNHPLALELLQETGPLAVSSANKHGEPAPATATDAVAQLGEDVNIFLDAGTVDGEASTILDATGLASEPVVPARIVREGAVSRETLAERLGDLLAPAES